MNNKQKKPQVSIDTIKQVVKKFKNQGFNQLTHYQLAIALTTIGFSQVCKEFGATWNNQNQKEALKILKNSQYDIPWYGKIGTNLYNEILPLCLRGDIEKIKDIIRTVSKNSRAQLYSVVDNFKRTALHLVVKQNFDILAQYLINQGFPINPRDRQLKTPLHYCKNELICQILLKNNANVFVKDNKSCTPVHYAASGKDFRVLEMLLQKTNVVNQVDSTKKTSLFYAIFNNTQEQVNIIRILIQNGANVNAKDIDSRTPLHYAAELGKIRCIPILLQKGASIDIRDSHNKTPIDLALNEKVRKIMTAYCQNKGFVSIKEQKQKRQQYSKITKQNKKVQTNQPISQKVNPQIYSHQLNQVSTWVREKMFVLMKKLQQAGVKSYWHIKRPYIYTGSWAQDIQTLQDLFETFLSTSGPEAAMRVFNLLCPYEKPLPRVAGRSQQAFQSFFGQNWFSTDPIQKVRNMHSQSKIRMQLQQKIKQNQNLQTQLLSYRGQIQKLQNLTNTQKQQLNQYKKIQEQLRKQRSKNTQQYSQMLKLINQKQQLKQQLNQLLNGQQKTKILSNLVDQLRSKNYDLSKQIQQIKLLQAAARRKCGQIFLKALRNQNQIQLQSDSNNLYDDDAIISLYQLLKDNPPSLEKRFKSADKRGNGKLAIDEFTGMLEQLAMLPQDVMSMHRITGFAHGRKTLSISEFKTILENRHKQRPMWQKQLIRKIKSIILGRNLTIEKFFSLVDKDGNGTIQTTQLRKGLQQYNIFMNQNDWSNLFNLLDADKSGQIDLNQLKLLLEQEKTGKLEGIQIKQQQKQQQQQDKKQQYNKKQQQKKQQQQNNQDQNKQVQEQQEQKQEDNQQDKKQEEPEQEQNKEQQFKQEYQQQQQDDQMITLNGQVKVQVPKIIFSKDKSIDKAYIKFNIADFQMIKMADLSLPKLEVAVKFEMVQYKIQNNSDLKIYLSIYSSRQFSQETYLGQVEISLEKALEKPNTWAINSQLQLQAQQYEKDVEGKIVIQAKWVPLVQEE